MQTFFETFRLMIDIMIPFKPLLQVSIDKKTTCLCVTVAVRVEEIYSLKGSRTNGSRTSSKSAKNWLATQSGADKKFKGPSR